MAKLNGSPLGPAEREALADQLIRVIGTQVPSLAGTAANWIQLAADSIIDRFEAEGIFGAIDIWPNEISALIDGFLTPESKGGAYTVARRIVFELGHFKDQRGSAQAESDGPTADPQIPTDETHDFGIIARELIENGSEIDMLQFGPSVVLTEEQALRALAGLKDLDGDVEFVLIARPKPPRWTVLDYRG